MRSVLLLLFFGCLYLASCIQSTKSAHVVQSNNKKSQDIRLFVDRVEHDLRKLWTARDRSAWVNQNFITDDTEALAAANEEATSAYMTQAINESYKFNNRSMPEDLARKLYLLRISQIIPAPKDAKLREELASIQTGMVSSYGKGSYCTKKHGCRNLDELSNLLRTSRNYEDLLDAWTGWHNLARQLREKFERYVDLANNGAREIGYSDVGAMWRSSYDETPAKFEADVERLWTEVKPIYELLHCYVRARLQTKYGKEKIPDHAPIPAHLLGNMWAQDWVNVFDLVLPYPGQPSLDINKKLRGLKKPAHEMVKLGEQFFTSLGFPVLPESFWKRSLFTRPRDRQVVCHASASDVTWSNDLRIKMCIEPQEESLLTIHHELGHLFYYQSYHRLPLLFQASANDGFHEGIGDTIALSVTPQYLQKVGLLNKSSDNNKATLNQQMKMALEKIAFLPFGLLIDKWRWDVFSGKTDKKDYNKAWWKLREYYQGVQAPIARSEEDFDPGAKFHIPNSTPYVRYFLARIYQFQFHRALCKLAEHKGPLHTCSIYGNKKAGEKLRAMLALGASRPWPEALFALSGESKADAHALLEYFAPLKAWLLKQTKNERCGWQ